MTKQWNRCSACATEIPKSRVAFAGYDAHSDPVYVGACCADQLSELATPVYWANSLNLAVPDDQAVWRYMEFAKFVAMLNQRGLYYSRADQFDDRFEGATGIAPREAEWQHSYLDQLRRVISTPPSGSRGRSLTPEEIEAEAQRLFRIIRKSVLDARQLLVSCWHGNNAETEALWRLHCPPGTSGVAIRSTAGRLWDACAQDDKAVVGKVHYLDYRHGFASMQKERIFQKRRSLNHEQEIRIVLPNDDSAPVAGRVLTCDLRNVICEVVTSPFAPSWFVEVITDVASRYQYSFEIKRSELLDEPFF